jgi:hypothetical protein
MSQIDLFTGTTDNGRLRGSEGAALVLPGIVGVAQARNREQLVVAATRQSVIWDIGVNEVTVTVVADPTVSFTGSIGTNDNDVVYTSGDISGFTKHYIEATAGTIDVDVSVDGTNYIAAVAGVSLTTTTPATRVVEAASGVCIVIEGVFKKMRINQKGATASNARGRHAAPVSTPTALAVAFEAPSNIVADTWLTAADSATVDSQRVLINAGDSRTFYMSDNGITRLDMIRAHGSAELTVIVEAA